MKRALITLMALMVLIAALPLNAAAEKLTGLTAKEIVAQMKLGWNLGNSFDATNGNKSNIYSQETSWGNPKVTKEAIYRVKEAGFSTIRIPVTWYRQMVNDGSYTIEPAFMARVKEVVDMAYDAGLFVIINMHHEAWLNCQTLDKDYEKIGVQLAAIWRQIADTFAEYDQHLIFEGMNEPRMKDTSVEWNGNEAGIAAVNYLNQVFVNTVRTDAKGYNGERALMIPTYAASCSAAAISALKIPEWNGAPAENIIASIHSYTPYDFCLSDTMVNFNKLFSSHTMPIDMVFYNIKGILLDKGIPAVMGETGATNKDNTVARENWAYYMGMKSASYGVPIVIWDNGNQGNSGGECHPWLNRRKAAKEISPFPTVLAALFEGAASVEWGYLQ